jgi:ferredoxin-like protein FixX
VGMASVAVLVYPLNTIFNEISAQIVANLYIDLIAEYLKFSLNSCYWCGGCYVICKYFSFSEFSDLFM